jgi:hypothetical protein
MLVCCITGYGLCLFMRVWRQWTWAVVSSYKLDQQWEESSLKGTCACRNFWPLRLHYVVIVEHWKDFLWKAWLEIGTPKVTCRIFCGFSLKGLYWIINDKQSKVIAVHALRVPGGWGSQISRQSAQRGGKVVSPTYRPPLPPGNIAGTHFCDRLRRSQPHGIDSKTFQ